MEDLRVYLNLPEIPYHDCNPLHCAHICEQQQQDENSCLNMQNILTNVSLQLNDDVDNHLLQERSHSSQFQDYLA